VERLVGAVRRECSDNVIVLGKSQPRGFLVMYTGYYNEAGTHLSLG